MAPSMDLGCSIPADTAHAVSVSLPTWKSNVGYEEGASWVVDKMVTGYPRFFVHLSIAAFAKDIVSQYSRAGFGAMLFPTPAVARRCQDFVQSRAEPADASRLSVIDLALDPANPSITTSLRELSPTVSAVIFPDAAFLLAKQYWQHAGEGVSSRRGEFCHGLFKEKLLVPAPSSPTPSNGQITSERPKRGPRRYNRPGSVDCTAKPTPSAVPIESQESSRFLEERFGRNLDLSLVERARTAMKRRIIGSLAAEVDLQNGTLPTPATTNTRGVKSLNESDVYLFPTGMNSIFTAHRALLAARGQLKSINFGFPYVDTLKILQKFGPGCVFYGFGSDGDLDDLERRLKDGERFLALFCEFPGNPLLRCPDLTRIRRMADEYDFAIVVDETIGTFGNISVLHVADVVVSSLTKIFSGDANVMGGSIVLNPEGRYYSALKAIMGNEGGCYEDTFWAEDAIFMERNSRDFLARIDRININAEAICDALLAHPTVKDIYYPKHNTCRANYDACRLPNGGYGGLLSVVFHHQNQAKAFYDIIDIAKGPSLGTNFTLCSPYVVLAHYTELPWAAEFGVDPYLVRISVGLEQPADLQASFRKALQAAEGAWDPAHSGVNP